MKVRIRNERVLCIILAILSSLSFCIVNDEYVAPLEIQGKLEVLLWQIQEAVVLPDYIFSMAVILFYFAYRYLWQKMELRYMKVSIAFSAMASLILLLCESYYKYDSWQTIFGCRSAFLLSLVRGIGIGIPFFFLFQKINSLYIQNAIMEGASYTKNSWKKFGVLVFLLMLFWLPYIIIMYPGSFSPDTQDEIAQVLGKTDFCWSIKTIQPEYTDSLWNTHHPPFYTFILSIFIAFGKVIHSYTVAFFLLALLQCIAMAAGISYFLQYIEKMGVNNHVRRYIFAFFALNPMFPLWGVTFTKDILFSVVLLVCIVQLHYFLKNAATVSVGKKISFGIMLLLLMLLRNNGLYMIVLLMAEIVWGLWKEKKKMRRILLLLLLPVLVFQIGVQGILFPMLHISKGSVREALSVPFQQTARYLRDYSSEMTPEDIENIQKVLGRGEEIEKIAEAYVPDRADAVKGRYAKDARTDELKNYFQTWVKGLISHPGVYIEAFFNLNYSWFSFDSRQDMIHFYSTITKDTVALSQLLPGIQMQPLFSGARQMLECFVEILARLPFTTWLIEFSFYTWLYLILLFVMLLRRKYTELLTCTMIYINYLICFVGPVAYTRYAIPMMVCAPFAILLTFFKEEKVVRK